MVIFKKELKMMKSFPSFRQIWSHSICLCVPSSVSRTVMLDKNSHVAQEKEEGFMTYQDSFQQCHCVLTLKFFVAGKPVNELHH